MCPNRQKRRRIYIQGVVLLRKSTLQPPKKMNKFIPVSFTALTALLASNYADASTTLISNNFDGGATTGPAFQAFDNEQGTDGSSDPATGVITTATDVTNSTYGLNNSTTVDASSFSSFTVTWTVSSTAFNGTAGDTSDFTFNGWFFGVVSGTDATGTTGTSLYNNNPNAIGIVLVTDAGGTRPASMSLVQDSSAGSIASSTLGAAVPTEASLLDGFSISLTINSNDTWSAISTGLSDDINATGTLNASSVLFADVASSLGTNTSAQGDGISYTLDSVTLTAIPEPSSLALFASGLGAMLVRRRRSRNS